LANVLSKHGFKLPLSSRPLNRSRYDLSRFSQPLKDVKPRLDGAKVETTETPLSIVLAEPGRCSLQGEKDRRLKQTGTQLATSPMDGFAPAQLGTDIDRLPASTRAQPSTPNGSRLRNAMGGSAVSLMVLAVGYSATLYIPGKAPWQVTGHGKIALLQRLVDAYAAGTPHVNTKMLMEGTGCSSPANLYAKTSPWRNYLVKVEGAHAWQLHLPNCDTPVQEDEGPDEAVVGALEGGRAGGRCCLFTGLGLGVVVFLPRCCFCDLLRGESSNEQGAETAATGDTAPSRPDVPSARRLFSTLDTAFIKRRSILFLNP